MLRSVVAFAVLLIPCMAQHAKVPNVESQRSAMKKLSFLVGSWAGEARIFRESGALIEMAQTEEAQYKLDGLLLVIEGIGRSKSDGKTMLQALGIISFDDEAGMYRMRAYNDGRYMETEVKLADEGKGITWGFVVGDIKTNSKLRINEKGEWTELTEISVGSQTSRKFMELRVTPRQ
jgi:hypothetical protein